MIRSISYAFFAISLFVFGSSVFTVKEGYQGILLQFGEVISEKSIQPGLHFKVPFIQKVVAIDKRVLNLSSESREVIALDQKRLIVNYYTKYRIVDPVKFYKSVKNEFVLQNRLRPIIESQMREQIGSNTLISLLRDARSSIMEKIRLGAGRSAYDLGVEIVDVRIKKTDLPEENSAAIFRRMQTDREKEAKEIRATGIEESHIIRSFADKESKIILAEAYRKSQILKGEGDAKAAQVLNTSFSLDEKFFEFYRSLQSYIYSLADGKTKFLLTSDNEFLDIFVNGGEPKKGKY